MPFPLFLSIILSSMLLFSEAHRSMPFPLFPPTMFPLMMLSLDRLLTFIPDLEADELVMINPSTTMPFDKSVNALPGCE